MNILTVSYIILIIQPNKKIESSIKQNFFFLIPEAVRWNMHERQSNLSRLPQCKRRLFVQHGNEDPTHQNVVFTNAPFIMCAQLTERSGAEQAL